MAVQFPPLAGRPRNTERTDSDGLIDTLKAHPWAFVAFVASLVLLPLIIAFVGLAGPASNGDAIAQYVPTTAPPTIQPVKLLAVEPEKAREINATVPFTSEPVPAARAYLFAGDDGSRSRATDCLAAAVIYEAGDDAIGERAVAQVVLNRVRHPAFPKTVCGVVFQGAERRTGCQFTFTCDGAMARIPNDSAWSRARGIARDALNGSVYAPVGYATHYHTDWVVPYWSASLDKVSSVGTHLFFRWRGWWGTPPAFRGGVGNIEPAVSQMARISPAHFGAPPALLGDALTTPGRIEDIAAKPKLAIDTGSLGKSFGRGKLTAIQHDGRGFVMLIDRNAPVEAIQASAVQLCAGRPQCRVMGWSDQTLVPRRFPIDTGALGSMTYSYIQDQPLQLQRSLWNCAVTPRSDPRQCMKNRTPVTASPQTTPRVTATFRIRSGNSVAVPEPVAAGTEPHAGRAD